MKYLLLSLASIFLFTGIMIDRFDYPVSKPEELVNSIIETAAHLIEKKYKIKTSGEGASMPGGNVRELTLTFDTKGPYSKEYLRKLLIECARELLNQININDEIKPFLVRVPFTIENVEIIIYNHDKKGGRVYDPEISTAAISQGVLTYRSVDPEDTYRYKSESEETYKQALEILRATKT